MKLLFTNAGRRTYLIEYALDLNRRGVLDLEVFVCDITKTTAAMWVSPEVKLFITPRVSDDPEHYASVLLAECRNREIEVIIPLMDYELPILAKFKPLFREHGIEVVVSDAVLVKRLLDKRLCYEMCLDYGIQIPITWYPGMSLAEAVPPLIAKRLQGSGSVGMYRIETEKAKPPKVPEDYVVQQMIQGQEHGMDVFNDMDGQFVHCSVRKKLAMRGGETDKAEVVYSDTYWKLGIKLSRLFRHVGNLDVDFIVDESGIPLFIDFNPRFGGGYPFTYAAGFDYLKHIVCSFLGYPFQLPREGKRIICAKGVSCYFKEI